MAWKDVVGFEEQYQISDAGIVYSKSAQREVSTKRNNRGYVQVHLYKNNICYMKLVHRIVAEAFVANYKQMPQVNHKDENKDNNNADNLEWCTNIYNRHYGTGYQRSCDGHDYKAMGRRNNKPVMMMTQDGECIKTYPSVITAQRETGITESNIRRLCYGKGKTAGGYKWQYVVAEPGANRLVLSGTRYRFEAVV